MPCQMAATNPDVVAACAPTGSRRSYGREPFPELGQQSFNRRYGGLANSSSAPAMSPVAADPDRQIGRVAIPALWTALVDIAALEGARGGRRDDAPAAWLQPRSRRQGGPGRRTGAGPGWMPTPQHAPGSAAAPPGTRDGIEPIWPSQSGSVGVSLAAAAPTSGMRRVLPQPANGSGRAGAGV